VAGPRLVRSGVNPAERSYDRAWPFLVVVFMVVIV